MTRKPVVLVTVEGGVVQSTAAPDGINVTVHDYDNFKAADDTPCVWCGKGTPIEGFIGDSSGTCPHCNNPTLPKSFDELPIGIRFLCLNGGSWRKTSDTHAECMENDSAFIVGESIPFQQLATVFPY